MGAINKIIRLIGKALFVFAVMTIFVQCSSESSGEDGIDDTVNQDNTDNGTDGGDTTGEIEDDGVDLTMQANPGDPQWFNVDYDDGITVNFLGEKDSEGIPESLTHIEIIEDEENGAVFFVDSQNRISEMVHSDGTSFRFDWQSDTAANLTVVTKDGRIQVNTEVDFSETGKTSNKSPSFQRETFNGLEIIRKRSQVSEFGQGTIAMQDVLLNVSQCGTLADAPLSPYFEIIDGEGNLLRTLYPKKVNEGVYTVKAPIPEPVSPSGSQLCADLAGKVTNYCSTLDLLGFNPFNKPEEIICPKVEDALKNLQNVPEDLKQSVIENCEALVAVYLPRTCSMLREGGVSLEDRFCQAETSDLVLPSTTYMYAVVPVAPIDKTSDSYLIDPQMPLPDFSLDLGDETIILDLILNPASPSAGVGYQAVVSVGCVTPDMTVEITVVGSDGFSDVATYTETASLSSADYSISIPGGAQGVQDTITVTVTTPDGEVLTRTASLVFG